MSRDPVRKRATVADVARVAGVSVATAGRVLGEYGNVRPDLRDRVRRAAAEVDYAPNVVARSMRSGSTGSIGFVGADIANPFFASAMRGVCDVAREQGYEPILANSDDRIADEQRAISVLLSKQIEGIVVSPTSVTDVEHLKFAQEQGVPVVLLDRQVATLEADSVVIDNEEAAYQAVRHLIELGHREIAILARTDPNERPRLRRTRGSGQLTVEGPSRPSNDRIRGYVKAMEEAGLEIREELVGHSSWDHEDSPDGDAEQLLTLARRPTAVFASDNITTQSAFQTARRHRLRIPGDLSLVGFDDLDWTTLVEPQVTVIAQSPSDMGRLAAQALFERIRGNTDPARHLVLPTHLIVRESARRL